MRISLICFQKFANQGERNLLSELIEQGDIAVQSQS